MRLDLEVRVRTLNVFQGVNVGHEVTAHTERVDELLHPSGLVDGGCGINANVGVPLDGFVGNAQGRKNFLVKIPLTDKQLVHDFEELAGASSLNDAMVVCAGEGDDFAHTHVDERLLARTLKLGRVIEGPGANDATLTLHETRHRVVGADAARVGERHGDALEVFGCELVRASTTHEVFVGLKKLVESHSVGALDARHHERPGAVGLRDVDGQAESNVRGRHHRGLAVNLVVKNVLGRELLERANQRVAQDVGERDLATATS